MSPPYTEITHTSYGNRLLDSLKGIVFGLILIVASVGLLYWNEGREDMSRVAVKAVPINAAQANTDATLNDKLVAITGTLASSEQLGDSFSAGVGSANYAGLGSITLKPGDYIDLHREVEIYSWVEQKQTTSQKDTVGGGETQQTTYSYVQKWVEQPPDSSNFKTPEGHENPPAAAVSDDKRVTAATVGTYSFDVSQIQLPDLTPVPLSPEHLDLKGSVTLADTQHLFLGKGTYGSPEIGDVRISYTAVPGHQLVTLFGRLAGTSVNAYTDAKDHQLYRILAGTKEDAIARMHGEFSRLTWILRGVGFLMMWIGFFLLVNPLVVLLDIVGVVGALGGALLSVATFFLALVISGAVILVSLLLHNILIVLLVVVLGTAALVGLLHLLRRKQ